ncbi:MAG: response regulator [Thaumarchaeota archaeon]|nr:response regulator [Nitrososphaerota archaeon]
MPEVGIIHQGLKTIVIDDDIDVRDLFVELLQMNNVNVVGTGTNGKEALDLYIAHKPELVFMDYLMPDFDGIWGAEKIRELNPHAKIVLISGSYFEDGKLDNVVSAVLKKPIEMSDVISTVNKMIQTLNAK